MLKLAKVIFHLWKKKAFSYMQQLREKKMS